MDDKELIKFVDWLMKTEDSPKDASFEETVSWINSLSETEDGSKLLNQLINTYKNSDMKLFKDGGKLKHLLCLKSGGKGPDCGCNKVKKAQGGSRSIGYTDEQRDAIKRGNYKNKYTDPYGNSIEEYSDNFNGEPVVFSRAITPQNDTLYAVTPHDRYNNYEPDFGYERKYFSSNPNSRVVQNFNKHRARLNRTPIDPDKFQKTQNALGDAYMMNEFNPTSVKTQPQTKPVQTAPVVSIFRGLNQPSHSYPISAGNGAKLGPTTYANEGAWGTSDYKIQSHRMQDRYGKSHWVDVHPDGSKYYSGYDKNGNYYSDRMLKFEDRVPNVDQQVLQNWGYYDRGLGNDFTLQRASLPKNRAEVQNPTMLKKGGDVEGDPFVTRRETKKEAKEHLGYTNKQFRKRYRDEKKTANGDRQKARWEIIDDVYPRAELELPVINDDIQIEDYNIKLSPEIMDLSPQKLGVTIQGYNEHMGDKWFKDAFRRARKYGLKEFEWNGKRYNTNLEGPETVETVKIVTSETPSIPVYIPENKKSLVENIKAAIINNAPYMK